MLFLIAIVVNAYATGLNYSVNWLVCLLHTFVANLLLINGFRSSALLFDTIIGLFLWLGFWLNFSLRIALMRLYSMPALDFRENGQRYYWHHFFTYSWWPS
jgi:hypothetical protein